MRIKIAPGEPPPEPAPEPLPPMHASHINPRTGEDELEMVEAALASAAVGHGAVAKPEPVRSRRPAAASPSNPETWGKVSRNDKCPCGSGKKYKHCHGKDD